MCACNAPGSSIDFVRRCVRSYDRAILFSTFLYGRSLLTEEEHVYAIILIACIENIRSNLSRVYPPRCDCTFWKATKPRGNFRGYDMVEYKIIVNAFVNRDGRDDDKIDRERNE